VRFRLRATPAADVKGIPHALVTYAVDGYDAATPSVPGSRA
jgi:hypothetical protein